MRLPSLLCLKSYFVARKNAAFSYGTVRFFVVRFLRDDLRRCAKGKIRMPRLQLDCSLLSGQENKPLS